MSNITANKTTKRRIPNKENMSSILLNKDDAKILLISIIEQAIRDYINLENTSNPVEEEHYNTACGFLFDDNYKIYYGSKNANLEEILDMLNINIMWLRKQIINLKEKTKAKKQQKKKAKLSKILLAKP